MFCRFFVLFCLLGWTVSTVSPETTLGQQASAPVSEDNARPDPPQQSAAWTPPATTLPKTLVSAAENLFQLGLGDPRGCEYREIVPDVYGHGWTWWAPIGPDRSECHEREPVAPQKFHGWVLPATKPGQRRFAICWNGVIYPLTSVGGPADLSPMSWPPSKRMRKRGELAKKVDRTKRILSTMLKIVPRLWKVRC